VEVEEVLGAISVMEEAALRLGRAVEPGAAVAAAQRAALAVTSGAAADVGVAGADVGVAGAAGTQA
jgi:hypothetical protein